MRVSLASSILVSLITLSPAPASAAISPLAVKPISPLDIPNNTLRAELGPTEYARAQTIFASLQNESNGTSHGGNFARTSLYGLIHNYNSPLPPASAATSVTLSNSAVSASNKPGANVQIDLKDLYIYINRIQYVLATHNQSLIGPKAVHTVDVSQYPELMPSSTGIRLLPQPHPGSQMTQAAAAPGASGCPGPEPTTVTTDVLAKGWEQIALMQKNRTVDRCDLVFRDELAAAESGTPVATIPSSIPITISGGNDGGANHWAQITVNNSFGYDVGSASTALRYDGNVRGQFFDRQFDIADICASVASQQGDDSTGALNVGVGGKSVFGTSGKWRDYTMSWPLSKGIDIVPPLEENFYPFGVNMHAELRVVGNYAVNAKIQTFDTGAFITISPTVKGDVTGGIASNFIIISAGIDGDLNLIDANANLGGIAAVFPDTTSGNKTILLIGTADQFDAWAFDKGVTLYIRTLFNLPVVTYPIKIMDKIHLVDHPSDGHWKAFWLASGSPPTAGTTNAKACTAPDGASKS